MARPIDAEKYMELLKEQYLHSKSVHCMEAARAWQGAMQLLYDMPILTQPDGRNGGIKVNDCTGRKYEKQPSREYPCNQCIRNPNDLFDKYTPK